MTKRILITGSSGFIGKPLVKRFKSISFDILELDIENGIDLTNSSEVESIDQNREIVIHLAAKSFVPDSITNPHSFYSNNINSTLNLLEYCRKNNSVFIFFSSYLYGNPQYLPINETHQLKPHNPYAQTKLIGEELCRAYNRDFSVPVVILRPFNIYGPKQKEAFLIPSIIKQVQFNNQVTLKDPRPRRDYIYIDDVISAVEKIVCKDLKGINIFNIGYGQSHSINDIVVALKSITGNETEVNFTNEYRKNEVLDTVASIENLYNKTGWKPQVDLKTGLKKIIEKTYK
jgi:nucleoside-diphosphate-sugar epimerase